MAGTYLKSECLNTLKEHRNFILKAYGLHLGMGHCGVWPWPWLLRDRSGLMHNNEHGIKSDIPTNPQSTFSTKSSSLGVWLPENVLRSPNPKSNSNPNPPPRLQLEKFMNKFDFLFENLKLPILFQQTILELLMKKFWLWFWLPQNTNRPKLELSLETTLFTGRLLSHLETD